MMVRPKTPRGRERALRRQGLRPVVNWVPDMTTPEFAAEARRQALAVAASAGEREAMEFLESLVDELPWFDTMEWDDESERTH